METSPPRTVKDALIADLLGDVGLLHDAIKALPAELHPKLGEVLSAADRLEAASHQLEGVLQRLVAGADQVATTTIAKAARSGVVQEGEIPTPNMIKTAVAQAVKIVGREQHDELMKAIQAIPTQAGPERTGLSTATFGFVGGLVGSLVGGVIVFILS